jgi:hypothetical protein
MEVVLPVAPVALVIHFFQSLQAFIFGVLTSLPCGPVEPTTIALCQNSPRESSLYDSGVAYAFGSLIAPCGVRSGDVRVRCLPGFVCIGRPLRFKLALSADYPCRAPAELNIALASIAFHARASVFLLRESESPQQLMMQTTLTLEHASSENGRDNGNSGRNTTEYTGFCADRFDNRLAETRVAAFVESTNTLLLARCFNDNNSDVSNLVAVDTVRKTICGASLSVACTNSCDSRDCFCFLRTRHMSIRA